MFRNINTYVHAITIRLKRKEDTMNLKEQGELYGGEGGNEREKYCK